jgi:hypothetical protein
VTNKIIKCLLFALNIVCSILFYKAGNFTPEMFSVIYNNWNTILLKVVLHNTPKENNHVKLHKRIFQRKAQFCLINAQSKLLKESNYNKFYQYRTSDFNLESPHEFVTYKWLDFNLESPHEFVTYKWLDFNLENPHEFVTYKWLDFNLESPHEFVTYKWLDFIYR